MAALRRSNIYLNLAALQALSHTYQGGYTMLTDALEHGLRNFAHELDTNPAFRRQADEILGQMPGHLSINELVGAGRDDEPRGVQEWITSRGDPEYRDDRGTFIAKQVANVIEFVSFRALTWRGEKRLREDIACDMDVALAAELGEPDAQTWKHYTKSHNPVIRTHVDEVKAAEHFRLGCDLMFLLNLPINAAYLCYRLARSEELSKLPEGAGPSPEPWYAAPLRYAANNNISLHAGIIAKAWQFFRDRSKLVEETAYEVLYSDLTDIQELGLGESARPRTMYTMEKAMQRARMDAGNLDKWTPQELEALRPAVSRFADGIIEGKFGVVEAVYAAGIALDGKHPELSMERIEELHRIGLKGIAEKSKRREKVSTSSSPVADDGATPEDTANMAWFAYKQENALAMGGK